ncbi:MAG TPA: hypothetical protein VL068_09975 [Microthrixaceae bacterium]|nr:hypothetical protein [Microthrixaceae bacterium]
MGAGRCCGASGAGRDSSGVLEGAAKGLLALPGPGDGAGAGVAAGGAEVGAAAGLDAEGDGVGAAGVGEGRLGAPGFRACI